jgi:uncharacterized protein YciI
VLAMSKRLDTKRASTVVMHCMRTQHTSVLAALRAASRALGCGPRASGTPRAQAKEVAGEAAKAEARAAASALRAVEAGIAVYAERRDYLKLKDIAEASDVAGKVTARPAPPCPDLAVPARMRAAGAAALGAGLRRAAHTCPRSAGMRARAQRAPPWADSAQRRWTPVRDRAQQPSPATTPCHTQHN